VTIRRPLARLIGLLCLATAVAGCQLVAGERVSVTFEPAGRADQASLTEAARVLEGRLKDADVRGASAAARDGAVVVEVPEGRWRDELAALLTVPGRFELRPVLDQAGLDERRRPFSAVECGAPAPPPPDTEGVVCLGLPGAAGAKLLVGPAAVDNGAVEAAELTTVEGQPSLGPAVQVMLDEAGTGAFARLTGTLACEQAGSPRRQLAIVLDGVAVNDPPMADSVACGEGITAGIVLVQGMDEPSARRLAVLAANGPLAVALRLRAGP
jgi:SecD/SecF fusion protein